MKYRDLLFALCLCALGMTLWSATKMSAQAQETPKQVRITPTPQVETKKEEKLQNLKTEKTEPEIKRRKKMTDMVIPKMEVTLLERGTELEDISFQATITSETDAYFPILESGEPDCQIVVKVDKRTWVWENNGETITRHQKVTLDQPFTWTSKLGSLKAPADVADLRSLAKNNALKLSVHVTEGISDSTSPYVRTLTINTIGEMRVPAPKIF